jgi:hypothetical protein
MASRDDMDKASAIAKKLRASGILDLDYDEIDNALVGPGALEEGRVAKLRGSVPPQGSPFLGTSKSIKETLKRFSPLYRR